MLIKLTPPPTKNCRNMLTRAQCAALGSQTRKRVSVNGNILVQTRAQESDEGRAFRQ
jgi:hypothetical protein